MSNLWRRFIVKLETEPETGYHVRKTNMLPLYTRYCSPHMLTHASNLNEYLLAKDHLG
jgi:hypothetical protein